MANFRSSTVHSFRYQAIRLAISYLCVFNLTTKSSSGSARAAGAQYTSLVTFGDSFTSNGRNADPLMNELYAPLGEKGRAVTWPNIFLKDVIATGTPAKLYNYAFNGAPANSNLTYMGIVPDTRTQIEMFMNDSKAGKIAQGGGRVLHTIGFNRPPVGRSYTETFLYMLDYLNEGEGYRPNPVIAKALDVLFILHADHELNAGTATVLQTGSTLVDPYSAVAAATAALYGPLHGGANEAVIRMLIKIGSPEGVPDFIAKVKTKEEVLSGFGHRVYKTSDPRSFIIRKTADEVFAITGKDKLLDTAIALHEFAIKDEYFQSRNLYPNVDFWSGLIYRALGFPTDFYPVLFAVPRVVGWLAHWRQMQHQKGGVKIWRPRQVYVGEGIRDYVKIEDRRTGKGEEPSRVEHVFSGRHFLATWDGKGKSKL